MNAIEKHRAINYGFVSVFFAIALMIILSYTLIKGVNKIVKIVGLTIASLIIVFAIVLAVYTSKKK